VSRGLAGRLTVGQIVRSCARVYLEAYTSILLVDKTRLEAFYGKDVILADRDMVETDSDAILAGAAEVNVAFLVVGDPFGATTHTDLLLRARALQVPTRVIHNASIMNAIGACGLQLYNFGQAVSLVFFTESWKPDSFYDRIQENCSLGMHTLLLLDIKVKEQSEENLARGRKIYEPPRYMSIPVAVKQLLEVESIRKEGILTGDRTLAIGMSRVGSADQNIVAGTLQQLADSSEDKFGPPLHSLVIVGKRLHPLEVEFTEEFATDKDVWRNTAQIMYGCKMA